MKQNNDSITIEIISPAESKEILDFLRPNFFKVEPLNKCINLVESEADCRALEVFCRHSISSGVSIKAVNDQGKLVGVLLNYLIEKSADSKEIGLQDGSNFSKITTLFDELNRKVNLFISYPRVNRILCNDISAVAPEAQLCGITTRLIAYAKNLAVKHNCGLIKAHCTNTYGARVLIRNGYRSIYDLDYKDYKVDGVVIFKPEAPHNKISVYVYEFND